MGFAVWIEKDLAWAQGAHEYRPMGAAVISVTDLFAPRDFSKRRSARPRNDNSFVGLFASLGHVNAFLQKRRSQANRKRFKKRISRCLSIL